jgi:hypothetical protein
MMSHDFGRSPYLDPVPSGPLPVGSMSKLRFAVAVYTLPATLAAVATGLSELGVGREQMHLVAQDETLAAASRELALNGHRLRLTEIARCMTYQETTSGYPWVLELITASAGGDRPTSLAPHLNRLNSLKSGPEPTPVVPDPRWEAGGGVVIVRLDEETSEQDVCGFMLRHRSTGVQTHDLRPIG